VVERGKTEKGSGKRVNENFTTYNHGSDQWGSQTIGKRKKEKTNHCGINNTETGMWPGKLIEACHFFRYGKKEGLQLGSTGRKG